MRQSASAISRQTFSASDPSEPPTNATNQTNARPNNQQVIGKTLFTAARSIGWPPDSRLTLTGRDMARIIPHLLLPSGQAADAALARFLRKNRWTGAGLVDQREPSAERPRRPADQSLAAGSLAA